MAEDELALLSREGTKRRSLQELVLAYIREKADKDEIPTSIRFLFYELEQRGVLSKEQRAIRAGCRMTRKPSQDLTDAITHLRDVGLVPWTWIVDDSRRADDWSVDHVTVADAVTTMASYARIDPWVGTARPVIISEAKTVGGVLSRRTARDYRVPVASTTGQCRGFLETVVAGLLQDHTRVLYIGDLDDAGDDIEANTLRVLERAADRTFGPDTWERLAITPEQVTELRRRGVRPILKTDARYRDGNPHEAFEAEALGQASIEAIVRRRLDELLPEALDDVLARGAGPAARGVKTMRAIALLVLLATLGCTPPAPATAGQAPVLTTEDLRRLQTLERDRILNQKAFNYPRRRK